MFIMMQFNGERILLVEDNVRLLRSAAFLLTAVGFEVQTAASVPAALDLLAQNNPALIITDLDMPNGHDLIKKVRSSKRHSQPSIICTSSFYELDDLMFALDLGADDYVPKPFDINDVLEAIARALHYAAPQRDRLAG